MQHGWLVQRSSSRLADITWTEAGGFGSGWDLVSSKEYIHNCPLPRLELSCSHSATSAPQSFTGSAMLCDQHCPHPLGQMECNHELYNYLPNADFRAVIKEQSPRRWLVGN